MRRRDDMNGDEFADPPGSRGSRISGRFYRADVAANGDCDKSRTNVFFALQDYIGRLYHRVGRFDRAHKSFGLDHAEGIHGVLPSELKLHSTTASLAGVPAML